MTTIVSGVPIFVVKFIAPAASSLEDNKTLPPDISTFLPAIASISMPPAAALSCIAPVAVPDLFVNVIVSSSLVPCGENIISVAPFLPIFNDCPSFKFSPSLMDPLMDSISILPVGALTITPSPSIVRVPLSASMRTLLCDSKSILATFIIPSS